MISYCIIVCSKFSGILLLRFFFSSVYFIVFENNTEIIVFQINSKLNYGNEVLFEDRCKNKQNTNSSVKHLF